jgi:hypothetical protein
MLRQKFAILTGNFRDLERPGTNQAAFAVTLPSLANSPTQFEPAA